MEKRGNGIVTITVLAVVLSIGISSYLRAIDSNDFLTPWKAIGGWHTGTEML